MIYSRSCVNPENLAKVDRVDFDKIGLTEIVKNKFKTQKQNV